MSWIYVVKSLRLWHPAPITWVDRPHETDPGALFAHSPDRDPTA
jgi:hypothetical protein